MAAKQKTDWDAVEPVYRAGTKSLRQIADEFGCTSGRVAQVAKERGWERDLSAKIKAKADAKVSKSLLSEELSAKKAIAESAVIDAESTVQARIRLEHRGDIQRYRTLCQAMLAELEVETGDPDLFEQIGELLASPDNKDQGKLNEAYRRAISLPQRIDGVKKLAETLKTLIGLEREAFGIDAKDLGDNPLRSFIDRVMGTGFKPVAEHDNDSD